MMTVAMGVNTHICKKQKAETYKCVKGNVYSKIFWRKFNTESIHKIN